MTTRDQLIAYLATLLCLALVIIAALLIAAFVPAVMGKMEVFGLGTVTGGLIGVLRIPSAKATSETQDQTLQTLADKVPPQTGEAAA